VAAQIMDVLEKFREKRKVTSKKMKKTAKKRNTNTKLKNNKKK